MQAGLGRVKANLASRVKKGGMSQQAADSALGRLKGTLDYNDFKSVDMVPSRLGLRSMYTSKLMRFHVSVAFTHCSS